MIIKTEDEIREEAVRIWTSAYVSHSDRWPRDRTMRYASNKAYKHIFKELQKRKVVLQEIAFYTWRSILKNQVSTSYSMCIPMELP